MGTDPHPVIEAQQGNLRHGCFSDQRTGDMHHIKSAKRFNWEGMTGALNNVTVNDQKRPMSRSLTESCPVVGGLGFGDLTKADQADDGSLALDQRQIRCQHQIGTRERRADGWGSGFIEEPCQHSA